MAPSKVDPNKKQARSSNDKDEENPFFIDRMAKTVSGPSQAPIRLAEMSPSDLYYECLDEGDARQCSIPTLSYRINMQERYAAARLTIEKFTHPVQTPQKTFSPYGDSDEESDCSPPTSTNTKATEKKIDDTLRIFMNALPHLETLHYGFKVQVSGGNAYCFCALATCLSPWRKKHYIDNDYSRCLARRFHGQGLLQHCHDKGDDYHSATFYYLTNLSNFNQDWHRLRSIME